MTAQADLRDKRRAHAAALATALSLAGCATAPMAPVAVAAPRVHAAAPQVVRTHDPIIGRTARQLEATFGAPAATLVVGPARRLQFASADCILDAYLYPAPGGEAAVTHVDTRKPTGEDIDRAACVAALTRR